MDPEGETGIKTQKAFTRNWFLNLFPPNVSLSQAKNGFRKKLLRARIFNLKDGEIIFCIPNQPKTTAKGREVEHLIDSLNNELAKIFIAEKAMENAFSITDKKLIGARENLSACQAELIKHRIQGAEIKKIENKIERWRNRISRAHYANGTLKSRSDLTKNLYGYFPIHAPKLSQNQIIFSLAEIFSALGEKAPIDKIRERIKRQFFRHDKPMVPKAVLNATLPSLINSSTGTTNIFPKSK